MIIPAIDLIDGHVVRLYQGDYEQKPNTNWTLLKWFTTMQTKVLLGYILLI